MRAQRRHRVWLQATQADRVESLLVLAGQLSEFRENPQVQVGRPDTPPVADRLAATDLLVLSGDVLPGEMIEAARANGTGVLWIEACAAPRLARRGLLPGRLRRCLGGLAEIHAADATAAAALTRYLRGAVPVQTGGVLARIPPAQPCNESELAALRDALGGRPAWFAYSLPETEFDAALAAQITAMRQAHRLLMIAAPRDPRDGPDLSARAAALGLEVARRQAEDEIDESVQVYVTDGEDAPGLFLRLASVSYLGGSLTPGTQVPSAPDAAALGAALVFGPEPASSFLAQLRASGGGRRIARPADLGATLGTLLAPEVAAAAALQAWTLATQGSDVTWSTARAICDWLALNPPRAAAPVNSAPVNSTEGAP
jgi:3-deoxy-D-manno-octulosonic-acid transferase